MNGTGLPSVNTPLKELRAYYMAQSIPARDRIMEIAGELKTRREVRNEARRQLNETTRAIARDYQTIMAEVASEETPAALEGKTKKKYGNESERKAETERRHQEKNRPLILQADHRETELIKADDDYEGLKREPTALTINKDLLVAEMGLLGHAIDAAIHLNGGKQ